MLDGDGNDADMQRLIDEARNGCVTSQNQLLSGLREYLALVADQELEPKLRAKAGPSDAVQQTMLLVSQKLTDFRGSNRAQLLAWVREILTNEIKQLRRSFKAEKRDLRREVSIVADNSQAPDSDPQDQLLTPQSAALVEEESQALRSALDNLPDDYRQVIELRNWQKLSFADIATQMNRSENAVTKLWFRALVKLEQQLGESN